MVTLACCAGLGLAVATAAGGPTDDAVRLLVVSDLHYVHNARHTCPIPSRRAELGLALLRSALADVKRHGGADALVLGGDLVDNGNAERAEEDLRELAAAAHGSGMPIVVMPGNHDGGADRLRRVFGQKRDELDVKGVTLVVFADAYGAGDEARRSEADLARLRRLHDADPARPIVALQHNPVWPPIAGSYPYCLRNADEVTREYAACGVVLSVSGHYHAGQPLRRKDGVAYGTAPALCEAPFRYLVVTVKGRTVSVEEHTATPDEAPR